MISVKFCTMVELCPRQCFSPFGGDIFRGIQMEGQNGLWVDHFWHLRHQFLPLDRKYLKNSKYRYTYSVCATA